MGKKLLVPSQENRGACLDQLWDGLHFSEEDILARQRRTTSWLSDYVREHRTPQASMAGATIAERRLAHSVIKRRACEFAESARLMQQSFGYVYWARELDICARQALGWADNIGDDLLHTVVAWQSISIACGSPWFALWVAPQLHNLFGYPGDDLSLLSYTHDKPARRFMEVLQRSLVTGNWPETDNVEPFGGYGKLLAALNTPERWADALIAYCDWRIANAYGYPEMGALKRRRQSDLLSFFDRQGWEQVFPVELFTLQYAYERATGVRLSLMADHPMLQSPLMTAPFPNLEPMYEDEWTRQLAALRESEYGGRCGLREMVTPKYL